MRQSHDSLVSMECVSLTSAPICDCTQLLLCLHSYFREVPVGGAGFLSIHKFCSQPHCVPGTLLFSSRPFPPNPLEVTLPVPLGTTAAAAPPAPLATVILDALGLLRCLSHLLVHDDTGENASPTPCHALLGPEVEGCECVHPKAVLLESRVY